MKRGYTAAELRSNSQKASSPRFARATRSSSRCESVSRSSLTVFDVRGGTGDIAGPLASASFEMTQGSDREKTPTPRLRTPPTAADPRRLQRVEARHHRRQENPRPADALRRKNPRRHHAQADRR